MASRDKEFSVDDLVQQVMADPKLHEQLEQVAEDYVDVVKRTWPKSIGNKTDKWTRAPNVFEIVESDRSGNRPYVHVHVNHAYALAHQARTGAFTKAASSLGLEMNSGGGG